MSMCFDSARMASLALRPYCCRSASSLFLLSGVVPGRAAGDLPLALNVEEGVLKEQ